MLSRFVPSPQYAEAESCKCEDRVWRCDGVAVEETVGTILWLATESVTSFTVLGFAVEAVMYVLSRCTILSVSLAGAALALQPRHQ